MGVWFANFLKRNRYKVIIFDKNNAAARRAAKKHGLRMAANRAQAVESSQLVLLATPTKVTSEILRQIGPLISPDKLVVEISSVKQTVKARVCYMLRKGFAVLSIHPMFGPGASRLTGKTVLTMSETQRSPQARRFISLLKEAGATVISCHFNEHDKLASWLLTLPHFISIAFVNALRSTGAEPNALHEAAGTTFRLQFLTAEAVCQEDLGNELSLLADNERALEILGHFEQHARAIMKTIRNGRREALIRTLHNARRYVQRDRLFASSYGRFNAAAEASSRV